MSTLLKLNLGCGPVQPEDWENIDYSLRARLAGQLTWADNLLVKLGVLSPTEFGPQVKNINLTKPLPYNSDSVTAIYAGELWEHLLPEDALKLTKECHRVLKPGGFLRLCVPDGQRFWERYLEIYSEEKAKPEGERSPERLKKHTKMFFDDICTKRSWLGSFGHFHKWQYDELQLSELLRVSGFSNPYRAKFHESPIEGIEEVERSDFLIVEAAK